MAKLSKFEKASEKYGCPFCKTSPGVFFSAYRYLDENGQVIRVTSAGNRKRARYGECSNCLARWPVFRRDEGLVKRDLIENGRTEEPVGSESRRIENNSSASIQRTIRVSCEWAHQIEYGLTKESRFTAEGKLAPSSIGLTTQMQTSIQEYYKVSRDEKQVLEEEITITVPANTSIEIILDWKRIWQDGYLEPGMGYGATPFRYCVGLTFDLQQRPLSSGGNAVDA